MSTCSYLHDLNKHAWILLNTFMHKVVNILQAAFSNSFSLMEFFFILIKNFTGICFQKSNRQIDNIVSDNGLVPNRRQAIM